MSKEAGRLSLDGGGERNTGEQWHEPAADVPLKRKAILKTKRGDLEAIMVENKGKVGSLD